MKTSKRIQPDLDTIFPILIQAWRRFTKKSGPPDHLQTREFRRVIEDIGTISEETNPFNQRHTLASYLLYYWPLYYQEALSVIGELSTPPRRVLDICSGPAPASFAALRHGASEVVAVDFNRQALDLGGQICGRYGFSLTCREWAAPSAPLPIDGTFDLIIANHCLERLIPANEMGWKDRRQVWIERLTHSLSENGSIILLTSSQPEINRRLLELRDSLVAKGIPVQAPCIWQGACPARKNKSPCYAQREMEKPYLMQEIQRAANIHLSSLKMSYLILSHPKSSLPKTPPLYRVISPPIDTHKGKTFYLCGTDGLKTLSTHLSKHPKSSRAFEYLRRGDVVSIKDALETPKGFEVIEKTTLSVVAACGKSLSEAIDEMFYE